MSAPNPFVRPGAVMTPFVVHALPRSRTAWLSRFLSFGGWTCHHEAAITMRNLDDVRALFARPRTGSAETAAAPGWSILTHHVPGIRAAVIRRPVEDVVAAMMAVDLRGAFVYDKNELHRIMSRVSRSLDRIAARPGVLTIDFADLETKDGCAAVFEHCLPYHFHVPWWSHWKDRNEQVDVLAHIQYYHANKAAVDGFKRACWREMRALARNGLLREAA